jgi:hypothetical protein
MKHPLASIDIHEAVYRFQGLFKKNYEELFLQEIKIRNELRKAYADSGYTGSNEEIEQAIEIIRRQD